MSRNEEYLNEDEVPSPYYRCSYNYLPQERGKLMDTIPITFSVEFDKPDLRILEEDLIRCDNCKAYLNCYCKIYMPGMKWKCNLCESVNKVTIPFKIKSNTEGSFDHPFLESPIYETETPPDFIIKTPDPPILIFLIEATQESYRNSLIQPVIDCIRESLRDNDFDVRTKACFIFFSDNTYVYSTKKEFIVFNENIPRIISDTVLFSIHSNQPNNIFGNALDGIVEYFGNKQSKSNDILTGFAAASQCFKSGAVFAFISSMPNFEKSALKQSSSLVLTNDKYKLAASALFRKNLGVNLFICTKQSVEISNLKILSISGGQIFHYTNFDGTDPVFTGKLFSDLNAIFSNRISFSGITRIRTNRDVSLKAMHGHFVQKGDGIFGHNIFTPAQSLNFEVSIEPKVSSIYVQVAMVRINKQGIRTLRVFNIRVDPLTNQIEPLNLKQIAFAIAMNGYYYESKKDRSGLTYLDTQLKAIYKELKAYDGMIPDYVRQLPSLILSLRKGIPLRPDVHTLPDFKVMYIYLLSNMNISVCDLIMYPVLINICDSDPAPYSLSINNIKQDGFYLLDTGMNMFFYVGQDNNLCNEIFDNYENMANGLFLFDCIKSTEMGNYVNSVVSFMTENRIYKPRFILVRGGERNAFNDIFKTYLYDDPMYGLPDIYSYEMTLDN